MSDVAALLGVLGAVDRAVVDDPSLVDRIAPLYPAYRQGAAGWVSELSEVIQVPVSQLAPPVPDALGDLAELAPRGRTAARVLVALAALARVRPELAAGARESEAVVVALSPLTATGDVGTAAKLHALVSDPQAFPSIEDWPSVMEVALADGLVTAALARTSAPVCEGRLVPVVVGGEPRLAPALTTSFTTGDLTLADIQPYLEPLNWPTCSNLWCSMQDITAPGAGPRRRILEEIGDCNGGWSLSTCLDFATTGSPDAGRMTVTYGLSGDQSQGDGKVLVDEGTIHAVEDGAGILTVTTTKRVLFQEPLSGVGLAFAACALGYASYGEDMIFSCALDGGSAPSDLEPWTSTGSVGDPGSCLEDLIAEGLASFEGSLSRARAGTYTTADLTDDISQGWERWASWWACLTEAGKGTGSPPDPGGD